MFRSARKSSKKSSTKRSPKRSRRVEVSKKRTFKKRVTAKKPAAKPAAKKRPAKKKSVVKAGRTTTIDRVVNDFYSGVDPHKRDRDIAAAEKKQLTHHQKRRKRILRAIEISGGLGVTALGAGVGLLGASGVIAAGADALAFANAGINSMWESLGGLEALNANAEALAGKQGAAVADLIAGDTAVTNPIDSLVERVDAGLGLGRPNPEFQEPGQMVNVNRTPRVSKIVKPKPSRRAGLITRSGKKGPPGGRRSVAKALFHS